MSKSGGKGHGGGKMTADRASAIQSAGDKNPSSSTAKSGFAGRAQSAAAKGSSGGSGKKLHQPQPFPVSLGVVSPEAHPYPELVVRPARTTPPPPPGGSHGRVFEVDEIGLVHVRQDRTPSASSGHAAARIKGG